MAVEVVIMSKEFRSMLRCFEPILLLYVLVWITSYFSIELGKASREFSEQKEASLLLEIERLKVVK